MGKKTPNIHQRNIKNPPNIYRKVKTERKFTENPPTMHRKCHFYARKSISGVAPTSPLKENLMSFNFIFSTFFSDAIWNSPAHSKWTQELLKSTRKLLSTLFQNFSKAFKWKHSIAKLKCTYSKISLNAYSSQTRWILAD